MTAPGLLVALCLLSAAQAAPPADPELLEIKSKLQILNLLNGLELDEAQMRSVQDAAKQAEAVRAEARAALRQKEAGLLEIGRDLVRNAEAGTLLVPEDLKKRWHAASRDLEQTKLQTLDRLSGLTAKVRDSLAPHQLAALDEYIPCVIPPLKTGRIGQADDASRYAKLLERVRAMPQDRYQRRIDGLARKEAQRLRAKAPAGFLTERGALERRLKQAADEARALPDVEFALRKEDLAKRLKAQVEPDRPPQNIGVKIERFLLQPEVIGILEQRLAKGAGKDK